MAFDDGHREDELHGEAQLRVEVRHGLGGARDPSDDHRVGVVVVVVQQVARQEPRESVVVVVVVVVVGHRRRRRVRENRWSAAPWRSAAARGDDSRLPHGDADVPVVMPSARGPRGAGWKPGGGGASASGIGALCDVALSKPSAARARGDGVLKPGGARTGPAAARGPAVRRRPTRPRAGAALRLRSRPASRRSATVISFKMSSSISCPRSVAA